MSIGPLPNVGAFAGTPLAQTRGTDAQRAVQETPAHEPRPHATRHTPAPPAAEPPRTEDRDADGRQAWQLPERGERGEAEPSDDAPRSHDPTGERGGELDLTA